MKHLSTLSFHSIERRKKVKVAQSCPALCDPHGIVHGILHARILGWLAVSFFRGSSEPSEQTQVSHIVADSLPVKPPGKPIDKYESYIIIVLPVLKFVARIK